MSLLDRSIWLGKAYSGGWKEPGGGRAAVIEPATGAELASVGIATPADIAAATAAAAGCPASVGGAAVHPARGDLA